MMIQEITEPVTGCVECGVRPRLYKLTYNAVETGRHRHWGELLYGAYLMFRIPDPCILWTLTFFCRTHGEAVRASEAKPGEGALPGGSET